MQKNHPAEPRNATLEKKIAKGKAEMSDEVFLKDKSWSIR